jgi:hypothetical protein
VTHEDSNLVEVFDLSSGTVREPTQVDAIDDGQSVGLLRWWPWWRQTDRLNRALASVTAAALGVAAVAVVAVWRAHPVMHRTSRTVVSAAPEIAVDALGCPRASTCEVGVARSDVLAAALAALPAARVTYSMQSVDASTGSVYRRVIELSAPSTRVQVVSQCVPGSAAVTESPLTVMTDVGSTTSVVSPDVPEPSGPKHFTVTVPGRTGCGINVQAETTLDDSRFDGQQLDVAVSRMAQDPRLMVTP